MNVNKNLIVTKWQDETALERFRMIAPLQDETLDPAKGVQLRKEIAEKNGLSYKTVKRYSAKQWSRCRFCENPGRA